MISLAFDLAANVAALERATTIKIGGDVPVRVTFSGAPGTVSSMQFALGEVGGDVGVLAFTDAFTEVSDRVWTALLDATDSRLVDFLDGKRSAQIVSELVVVIDGEKIVCPNITISVQSALIVGPVSSDGGPTYYTTTEVDAAIASRAVRFDTEQSLDPLERAQARANIGAMGPDALQSGRVDIGNAVDVVEVTFAEEFAGAGAIVVTASVIKADDGHDDVFVKALKDVSTTGFKAVLSSTTGNDSYDLCFIATQLPES